MPRSYAILGTGAVGGYYGAKLFHAGLDVHFLFHSDFAHVCRHGLEVRSAKEGDLSIPADRLQAYADVRDLPPCDVVAVAWKATQNAALLPLVRPPLKEDGVVLVLQNGLGVEQEAAAVVGASRVMGGMCFICTNKLGPGRIHHLDYGWVRLAELGATAEAEQPAGITPRLRAIGGDFERAGITVRLSDDLMLARWQKLVWNIPYNGLSVVLDATTDQLMADPPARALVERLMGEVVAGAAACGRTIEPAFVQDMLDHTIRMAPYRTSMKIDYDEGRPMEVEPIFGAPLRWAAARGAELPAIRMLYEQLKFIDGRQRMEELTTKTRRSHEDTKKRETTDEPR